MSTTSRTFQAMGQFMSEMNRNMLSFVRLCPHQLPNDVQLNGQTYIVTGGNRGFGKGVTLELVARGAQAIIAARGSDAANLVIEEANKLNPSAPKVMYHALDLTSFESIRAFSNKIKNHFGAQKALAGLVNNAGLWTGEQNWTPARADQESMELSWAVNVFGLAYLTNQLIDTFIKGARVVNVGSLAHLSAAKVDTDDPMAKTRPFNWVSNYAESKLASMFYTKQLAKQLIAKDIYVYGVDPGISQTELSSKLGTAARFAMESWINRPFYRAPVDGSRSILFPLVLNTESYNVSNWYYCDGVEKAPGPQLNEEGQERAVWTMVNKFIGVDPEPEFIP